MPRQGLFVLFVPASQSSCFFLVITDISPRHVIDPEWVPSRAGLEFAGGKTVAFGTGDLLENTGLELVTTGHRRYGYNHHGGFREADIISIKRT